MRRQWRIVAGLVAVAIVASLGTWWYLTRPTPPKLETAPDWYVALDQARGRTDAANQAWVDAGTLPGQQGPFADLVRSAALDLRRLSDPSGAVAAGAAPNWAYDWPRDTAFTAVAFDRIGHRADALAALSFLARMQRADGSLAARYLLDGSGVPDDRPDQGDGPGWVLWALGQMAQDSGGTGAASRLALPADVQRLADRSLARLLDETRGGTVLPPPTPDYWEVPEKEVTLGLAAPVLAGLEGASRLYDRVGDASRAAAASSAARAFGEVVKTHFGPRWERYGAQGGPDAAVLFVRPPFVTTTPSFERDADTAGQIDATLHAYEKGALRPSGGLAPGVSWKHFDEAWTPETALVAYSDAAVGDTESATAWLRWLDAKRTSWGALPEKVMPDGSPAGPAPLAWTCALVILTAYELDRSS